VARAVFEAIDGERTIADVRLHLRGSEYLVYRCLFELLRSGHLAVAGIKRAAQAATAERPRSTGASAPPLRLDEPDEIDRPARAQPAVESPALH
jgi:hypothetical protein